MTQDDRDDWLPPPSQSWQDAHGWQDGKPPPNGNGQDQDADRELLIGEPAESEASIASRVYVVPGCLPRGVITELIGPSSAGKSQLTVMWAVALALGREIGGFKPTRPMRVAVFNAEDDIEEQRRRVAAALRLFGATKTDLGGRLRLLTPKRTGMLIEVDPETRKLRHTALMAELLDLIDEFKPDLLILDPLVELHDAPENDNTALRHVIAEFRVIARMQDIAILLLHHTPKGDPRPGDQDAGRGASAIGGVVRKSFTLFEMTEAEAAAWKIASPQYYFRLDGAKANYDTKNATEWFERIPVQLDNRDVAAAAQPWQPPSEAITEMLIDQLMDVVAAGDNGYPWSRRLGAFDRSISKAFASLGIGSKKAQQAALDALWAAGCIEAAWRKPDRVKAMGIRHPNGHPDAQWVD
jgi:RecA-family ATPase